MCGHDLPVCQCLDRRRLQSLPHHPRRHRLGGRRSPRSVVPHRLLGRPPDYLPAEAAGDARAPRARRRRLLTRDIFAYANVPYRIKPYAELLEDPKETVVFDAHLDKLVRQRVQAQGADGKLLWDKQGHVRLVNLTEKLLVSVLAKLANFIPEAGIWLNTQRPGMERRQQRAGGQRRLDGHALLPAPLPGLLPGVVLRLGRRKSFTLSAEVDVLGSDRATLQAASPVAGGPDHGCSTQAGADDLGRAGSAYRQRLYAPAFRTQNAASADSGSWILRLRAGLGRPFHPSQPPARRALSRLQPRPVRTRPGFPSGGSTRCWKARSPCSVPASSRRGIAGPADRAEAQRDVSRRPAQLPALSEPPAAAVRREEQHPGLGNPPLRLLRKLLADGNRPRRARCAGRVHFNGSITNARDVRRILEQLAASGYAALVKREGRSCSTSSNGSSTTNPSPAAPAPSSATKGSAASTGTWFPSSCWPCRKRFSAPSKPARPASVLKAWPTAITTSAPALAITRRRRFTARSRWIPYSHTPAHGGARQPGLTGQVKEDFLCRLGELGVVVEQGRVHFRPQLLRREEFVTSPCDFVYYDVAGAAPAGFEARRTRIYLLPGAGRLPPGKNDSLTVVRSNAARESTPVLSLDAAVSRSFCAHGKRGSNPGLPRPRRLRLLIQDQIRLVQARTRRSEPAHNQINLKDSL